MSVVKCLPLSLQYHHLAWTHTHTQYSAFLGSEVRRAHMSPSCKRSASPVWCERGKRMRERGREGSREREMGAGGVTSSDWHVCLVKHMTRQPVRFTDCRAARFTGLSSLHVAVNLTVNRTTNKRELRTSPFDCCKRQLVKY